MKSGVGVNVNVGEAVLVGVSVSVGVSVIVGVSVGGSVSVIEGDRVALAVSDAVGEGPAVVGIIVFVKVGGRVFVLVGWAATVCETIASAVMATTVGICSSGINVGNGSGCGPNVQLPREPTKKNSTPASTIFIPDRFERLARQRESAIAGCVSINNR